jgi:hypothetical protein
MLAGPSPIVLCDLRGVLFCERNSSVTVEFQAAFMRGKAIVFSTILCAPEILTLFGSVLGSICWTEAAAD